MNGYQCDNCKTFAATSITGAPEDWLMIFVTKPRDAGMFGVGGNTMVGIAAFCGWPCIRDYSVAKTLVDDPEPSADS